MTHIDGIGRFEPCGLRDRENWQKLLDLLDAHPAPFGREPNPGHITGSAFVLSPDGTEVLLTHHAKLDMWLQLGGHCDGIADVPFVALKEAYEESGISRICPVGDPEQVLDLDIQTIPANARDPEHLHFDLRYLFRAQTRDFTVSAESKALAWVPLSGLERYTTNPGVLVLREKARRVLDAAPVG